MTTSSLDRPAAFSVGHATEAWLCLLPAEARRFRVDDARLAAALEGSGALVAEDSPDVEIGPVGRLQSDAPVAVVPLGQAGWARGSRVGRALERSRASARARASARRAARALRLRGYPHVEVMVWDVGQAVRRAGVRAASIAELLPQGVLVFGRREPPGPSILDAVLADAGAALGTPLTPVRLSARGGVMLAFCERELVRVAVGPGRRQVEAQRSALESLRRSNPPDAVARLVPWPLAAGQSGLGEWTVEPLMPGRPAGGRVEGALMAECSDFLVGLHSPGPSVSSLAGAAEVVAEAAGPAVARFVRATGARLDDELAGVPRGFGHGDFFAENLLVEGGRLSGVVDWDAAGPGRLPLLDLLHLIVTSRWRGVDLGWGPAIASHLLPWARDGGDETARDHCARVGIDPDPALLERLAVAYWLDRAAAQLSTHAEYWEDRAWIEANVAAVARAVSGR